MKKVAAKDLRTNDPQFMSYRQTFFKQTGEQVKGLMWKDGSPIFGIQLENEYFNSGPNGGDAYIVALKRVAIQDGFDVPLYTVTGWEKVVPKGAVLPVYGGVSRCSMERFADDVASTGSVCLPPGKQDYRQVGGDRQHETTADLRAA